MNRRHAAGLVSLLAGAMGLAGCSEPVRNDGRMFERWADAVAAIPIDGGSHAAAPKPPRQAQSPLKIDLGDHVDAQTAKAAKDVGLRAALGLVDSELAGLRRKVSFDETAEPHATVESAAEAGAFMAQLAAFPTREAAESGWARLKQAHPDVLGRLSARFEAVDLGGRGVWTRLQAGPFPSRSEAAAVCSGIGAPERGCVVARRD
jgi:cell division septation protein DedD